jgi:hypothetical protein
MTKEELEKLKVKDVIGMPDFLDEMRRQIMFEERSQTQELLNGRLNRTPLDSLREKKVFNAERMTQLFEGVLNKSLLGFSSSERTYIYSIGMFAFTKLMMKLQKEVNTDKS